MKHTALIASFIVAAATLAGAQDQLSAAKDLYASAAYEDALSMLSHLTETGSGAAPDVSRQAEQYRAFCLYALGRTAEAETVVEGLIRKDPLIEVNRADASPRIEALFTAVRKRLLPGLIRDEYRAARASLDTKKLNEAEPHLQQASRMLVEAKNVGAWDDTMADLRVLIDGFLELTRASQTRQADGNTAADGGAPASASAAAPAPSVPTPKEKATAVPAAAAFFTAADLDVVPPAPIRQVIPGATASLLAMMGSKTGVLDLEIDEAGAVQKVTVRTSLHPIYDRLLVQTARHWEYRPATKGGVPVKYVKTVAVNVKD